MEIKLVNREQLLSQRMSLIQETIKITNDMMEYNKRKMRRLNTIKNKLRKIEEIIE